MADIKEYKREYVKNYRYVKAHFRKGVESDERLFEYLQSKENVSEYLKDLVRVDFVKHQKEDEYLRKIGVHPLQDLIQSDEYPEFRHCYDERDVIAKLDQMNTSRETHYFDRYGKDFGTVYHSEDFLRRVARPDLDGYADWHGWLYCGPKLKAIVKVTGYDWSDEEQCFLGETEEIIGYDW